MLSISKHHPTTATLSQPTSTPITKKTIASQTKQINNQHVDLPKSILKSTSHKTQNSQENKGVKFSVMSEIKYFDQNESSLFYHQQSQAKRCLLIEQCKKPLKWWILND